MFKILISKQDNMKLKNIILIYLKLRFFRVKSYRIFGINRCLNDWNNFRRGNYVVGYGFLDLDQFQNLQQEGLCLDFNAITFL